jgi:Carboxypeptidase regulatory-like domain/TonB dependent receptor
MAWSQAGNGIVKGSVVDASGSIVQGSKVRLTNRDTNISRQDTTSSEGYFYFGQIPPGPYTLEVEQTGFDKWSGDLTVQVGQTVVIEPKLTVGSIANTISVTDAAPVITTEGMQVADVKDAMRIHQLPLNGRQISNLFNLTPGVEGGGAPRVNGMKVGAAEIVQDGITIVDRFTGGIQRVQPGLDTVQEFRIETSGSNARYPRPATVTLVTKSGTNQLHGTLFETFRNNADGLRARTRQDGASPAKLIRNEFGGSAGGPVILPKLYNGKNKTFWFFSYEGLRQREKTFDEDYVPTPDMFRGDFSHNFDNNGVQTHIFDPLTTDAKGVRQQFPGDIIPTARLSPFFATMQSITHTPTNPTNPFQGPNLDVFYPLSTNTDSLTAKGDHRFSDSDNLSLRFTRSHYGRVQAGGRFGSPADGLTNGFGSGLNDTTVYSGTLTETHIFTPNVFSELLIAVNRNPNHQGTLADFTNWSQKLGLPNPFGTTGWPTITAGGFPGNNWDADNAKDQNLTAYHLEDNMTWVKGKHSFQFGGRIRREDNNVRELQQAQGSHDFAEAWTAQYDPSSDQALPFTGVGVASMALGLPTFLSNQFNRGYFYFQQYEVGLYAHDSWKVSPKLTLELGLRWDKWTPYSEKYDRLVTVDLRNYQNQFQVVSPNNTTLESMPNIPPTVLGSWAARGLTWTTADKAGLPSNLVPSPNNDFGPRLGVAYRLDDKTAIRAGFGEYYWTLPLSQILQTSRTNPPLNLRYTNPLGTLDGTSTFAVRSTPQANYYVGQAQVDTNGVITIPPTSAQGAFPYDFRNWEDTRATEWQFTIERQLMRSMAMRLSYIGNHGSNLEQRYALNNQEAQYNYEIRTGQMPPANRDFTRVNPNWNFSSGVLAKNGYSNTNTLQAQIERRYSAGLAFQVFYTFTRSLTTTDAGAATSGNGSINDTTGVAVVPENIQLLGAPNLSYDQRLRLGYYNSTAVPPHRLVWNGIYDLPFGRGKKFGNSVSRLTDALIGGWQLATIGNIRSGTWLSVTANDYLFGDPGLSADQRLLVTFNGRQQRLYFAGDFDPRLATNVDQSKLQALVPVDRGARKLRPLGAAFDNRLPVTLANGTVRLTPITDTVSWNSRAFIVGPKNWNVDGSVFKNFSLTERVQLRFTADFFNMFNHPNDINPNATTGLVDLSQQVNDPRIIQFSLRLSF